MYQRHGHLKEVFVKVGDKVKKGQKIGTVGNGNGQYINASHDHADFPVKKLSTWTGYVFGWTKEEVRAVYADPKPFRKICAPWLDHFGWGYLEYATYGKNKCYHPGEDWNGRGSGDSDFGLPIYSAFDGEVVYCYAGKEKNSGWGKLLVIKEVIEEVKKEEIKVEEKPKTEAPKVEVEPKPIPEIPEEAPKPEETNNPNIPEEVKIERNLIERILEIIINFLKKWKS